MPRKPEGTPRKNASGTYSARITLHGKRCTLGLSASIRTDEQAAERTQLLAQQAHRMAGVELALCRPALEQIAAASTPKKLDAALTVVTDLVGGWQPAAAAVTVRQLGERWTSGELAKEFPDHVRARSGTGGEAGKLEKHIYPIIGDLTVDAVTLDGCMIVSRNLPPDMARNTRVNILATLAQLLNLAVFPCRLITASPLPPKWVPSRDDPKAHSHLFADEELRLMRCAEIPLVYRLLWGWLARQGQRDGEAFRMRIYDVDLAHSVVKLDRNKTRRPRSWALEPGDALALRRYLERYRPGAKPGDYLFVDEDGKPFSGNDKPAQILREHLTLIGLHDERPYLFETTETRLAFRVHDLRSTFIVLSLAAGKNERWIQQRTGHKSSRMINAYAGTAETAREAKAEPLATLDLAVPELGELTAPLLPSEPSPGKRQRNANGSAKYLKPQLQAGIWHNVERESQVPDTTEDPMITQPAAASSPVQPSGMGDSLAFQPAADPVIDALAFALKRAAEAGQWAVVEQLARELEARRRAQAGVISLDEARKRRT